MGRGWTGKGNVLGLATWDVWMVAAYVQSIFGRDELVRRRALADWQSGWPPVDKCQRKGSGGRGCVLGLADKTSLAVPSVNFPNHVVMSSFLFHLSSQSHHLGCRTEARGRSEDALLAWLPICTPTGGLGSSGLHEA
ncbi:uncharacterized protein BKA78DRAFT_314868 [Phyllosticta capitalensis]|uniref:uncharacterized protein n=1 Tax=Phyllosticta capitalensis TaxID=121624 RepID=UPI0031307710